jgi:hypothetical protein
MMPSGLHEFQAAEPVPEPEPGYAPYQPLSIEWWIERVDRAVQEAPQMGTEPILSKAAVMAQFYTVQVMERQAVALEKIAAALQRPESQTLGERVRAE